MKHGVALLCALHLIFCAHREQKPISPVAPAISRAALPVQKAGCPYQLEFTVHSKLFETTASVFVCDWRELVAPPETSIQATNSDAMTLVAGALDGMLWRNNLRKAHIQIAVVRARTSSSWMCVIEVGQQRSIAHIEREAPFLPVLLRALGAFKLPAVTPEPKLHAPRSL